MLYFNDDVANYDIELAHKVRNTEGRVVDDANNICDTVRRMSQVSRMLCATNPIGSDAKIKHLKKSEISNLHSKLFVKLGGFFDEMTHVTISNKMFRGKVLRSVMKGMTTSF